MGHWIVRRAEAAGGFDEPCVLGFGPTRAETAATMGASTGTVSHVTIGRNDHRCARSLRPRPGGLLVAYLTSNSPSEFTL